MGRRPDRRRSGAASPRRSTPAPSGYENFGWFRRSTIDVSPVKVLAFLHIGSLGLPSMNVGELEDARYIRVADTVEVIERNRDVIVGVKARLGHAPAGDNVMVAAQAAIEAALTGRSARSCSTSPAAPICARSCR